MTGRAGQTILVVEDDRDIRESIQDVLEGEGYAVVTAADGREGLERLRALGAPCLVVLDLMMPIMSGGEFLAEMRRDAALATIPVVLLSAWVGEAARMEALTQGYVKKPVVLESLMEAVQKYCRGRD